MGGDGAADHFTGDRHVGYLRGHADDEREVDEVPVVRIRVAAREGHAPTGRLVVKKAAAGLTSAPAATEAKRRSRARTTRNRRGGRRTRGLTERAWRRPSRSRRRARLKSSIVDRKYHFHRRSEACCWPAT